MLSARARNVLTAAGVPDYHYRVIIQNSWRLADVSEDNVSSSVA